MTVDPADATYVHELMERTGGHDAGTGRDFIVASRLTPLATELGFGSVAALVAAVRAGDVGVRRRVVDAMTNNETFFFVTITRSRRCGRTSSRTYSRAGSEP